ncbi:MAG: Amuc_1098 family type IV pilus outer membrane protein [Akkermansiaceae bacterium]|nr:Amuc_1098 family type IV pilus outer membrane protein [Akkermansiaceae bacterium]
MATATAALPLMPAPAPAQDPSMQNLSPLAKREIIRRQNDVAEADELFREGRAAYAAGDFQKAVNKFSTAKQMIPDAPLFSDRIKSYDKHFTDASVALAMVYREQGRLEDAETIINDVLAENPANEDALRQKRFLADPLRTNPALTEEYTKAVAEVNQLLVMADSAYMLGKFDESKKYYEQILLIDKYNTQARRGLERVANAKLDYHRAAYDHTRIELLQQVEEAWELAVPDAEPVVQPPVDPNAQEQYGIALITEKLRRIKVNVDFNDTTVEDAIEFLRQRARELDTVELDPDKKGVNFVVRTPDNAGGVGADDGLGDALGGADFGGGNLGQKRIPELRLRNVPLEVALDYICEATDLRYKIDNYAVTLVPKTDTGEEIFPRTFTVPPDFRDKLAGEAGDGGGTTDPFAVSSTPADTGIKPLPAVDELLRKSGIIFPDGASATLTGNKLLVSNTPTELDKVEQLVNNMIVDQPKQVRITTKFVEVTQENGEELGFDWVIGPFFSGDGNLAGSGGTIGNGSTRTGLDFSGPGVPGVTGSDVAVSNIVTAGNRSGNFAITGNTIDGILNNPTRATQSQRVAPGIMSLTGLFSEGQLKVIMRGLSQKKGVDLMTAPSITARSGEQATIEIIREFIYPTEYDPPELQQGGNNLGFGGGGGGGGVGNAAVQAFPVVPANPTAFETRNTGVTLEIEPTIGENDFMINLRFVPEIVEFEGFINYGSPIQTAGTDALGNPVTVVITENRIEMPVFATRRVNSALTIYDGYTVAIGGLMREDVQNIEDSVPILGDIPVIGRLFQTKAERRIKSNLIIFVKAQIIDPTGRPIRGADNESDNMSPINVGAGDVETAS